MKIRRALIGSTVLFTTGCWGPTPAKIVVDAGSDSTSPQDTAKPSDAVGKDTLGNDTLGNDTLADVGTCYERPDDPRTLAGTACSWPEHVECNSDGLIVVQCLDSLWTEKSFGSDGGEICRCENPGEDCTPPTLLCEVMGVGFLGINVAGWDRQATRTLRLV